jgi:hypothetical protein
MAAPASPSRDAILVIQCQAGDPAAWEQLFSRLRQRAEVVLGKAFAGRPISHSERDEIFAEVLASLFMKKRSARDAAWPHPIIRSPNAYVL